MIAILCFRTKMKKQHFIYLKVSFILVWLIICLPIFMNITYKYLDKKDFIHSCILAAQKGEIGGVSMINYQEYCACAYEKMQISNESDIEKIKKELNNKNGVLFNETILSCLDAARLSNSIDNNIDGENLQSIVDTIPLLKFNGVSKLKIEFGGYPYYFIFDTGAGDILVSENFISELKTNGVVKNINYLKNNAQYIMANGDTISCKQLFLRDIKIGQFVIDSSLVGVYNGDIDFLLGSSFLKKFKNYSVIENNNYLILEKQLNN